MVFAKRTCRACGKDYFGLCPCGDTDKNRLGFTRLQYECLHCHGHGFDNFMHQGEIMYHNGIPYLCPNDGRHMVESMTISTGTALSVPWILMSKI